MKIRSTLIVSFLIIALIGILHGTGIFLHLYWRLPWYDSVVHTLSGFWAVWVILLFFYRNSTTHSLYKSLVLSFVISLSIGLVWEIFESLVGLTSFDDPLFWRDTMGDFASDVAGGIIAAVVMSLKYRIWNNQTSL